MNIETARKIVEFLHDEDIDEDAKVYENYSGRGMYGATTTGVTILNPDSVHFAMGRLGMEFKLLRKDNMGLSMIIY